MEWKSVDFIDTLFYLLLLKYVTGQCDDSKPLLLYATSSPQYFTSPDYPAKYPPNSDCSWRVLAPNVNDKIIINIEVYASGGGSTDYMDIYDGYNSSSTYITRMPDNLNAFISSSDVLFFTFISNAAFQYAGFQILYFSNDTAKQPACNQTLDVTTEEQVLMSANLPDVYNEFHACAWTFSSTDTILFQIKFLDMGECGTDSLKIYDGNLTAESELGSECSPASTYTFDDITTTGLVAHVTWTVTNQSDAYYGFMLVYRKNIISTTTTTTTTTTVPTTTLTPSIFDNCTTSGAYFTPSVSPNFDYIYSPDYESGKYPKNKFCRWYITAPENYSVEAYFDNKTYAIERNVYCRYDYVIFYDGNSTSDTMLDKFCGFSRPTSTYRTSGTQMLIIFSSDYLLQYAGFRIRIKSVSNAYPVCKSDYTEYSVSYNIDSTYIFNNYTYINNLSSPNFGISDYPLQIDMFWLFTSQNTTHYKMVLDILTISIERAYRCIYDRLVLYDGPCIKDGIKDTICGYWAKRWDLEGPEYLLQFHSDGYITRAGFQLIYYSELKSVPAPPTTTTTTQGPPVEAVVDAIKEMLTNYSSETLPTRNLSAAIEAYIDFYLVGINGIDEVEQKMTSTGQFEVKWQDSSLSWDPTKRQGVVQVLLPQNDIWKPDIALMNGFTSITAMGAKFMFINVDYNGSCIWKPYQIMESVCKVDMTHYPYDRQTCVLKFGTWSTDDSEVITELGSLGLQIHPNFQENSEWRLIKTETKQEDNNNHKVVEFFITIERNPRYVTFYMTMPLIVLAYMNVFTFVIPSESGEKTGYSITIFLSFVVLLIINNDSLPENSDTISLYAAFVLIMTILSAIALVVSVLQIRALTFEERRYPIANCVKTLIRYVQYIQSVLTCRRKKSETDDDSGKEEDIESKRANSSLGSNINEVPSFVKKVSFKDDSAIESEADKDRFILPNKRSPSKVNFRIDRENTLFETNTFIRSATALSFAEKQSTENKPERRVSITKAVKFSDEEAKPDETKITGDNAETCPASEKSTIASGTADSKEVTTSSLSLTKSDHILDQIVSSLPTALVSQSMKINEIQSTLEIDQTDHNSTEGTESSTMDLYRSSPDENITPVQSITVSPKLQSSDQGVTDDKNNQEYNQEYENSSEKNLAKNQNVLQNGKHLQVTGIVQLDVHSSEESKTLTNEFEANIKSASRSTKSPLIDEDKNNTASLGGSVPYSLSEGVDSSMTFTAGNQSGSLADDLVQNDATSASDFKTGRPSTAADNRPLSVNAQVSLSGSRIVLADHGRASLGGRDRPISRHSQRAVSALSHRSVSFFNQRPTSSLNVDHSTALLFGDEEMDKKSLDEDAEINSIKSKESASESSESSSPEDDSEENDLSWPDLVSCTDAVLFVLYLLLTTVMTLAMFMTMIQAY